VNVLLSPISRRGIAYEEYIDRDFMQRHTPQSQAVEHMPREQMGSLVGGHFLKLCAGGDHQRRYRPKTLNPVELRRSVVCCPRRPLGLANRVPVSMSTNPR
jgi:hypothetical protein